VIIAEYNKVHFWAAPILGRYITQIGVKRQTVRHAKSPAFLPYGTVATVTMIMGIFILFVPAHFLGNLLALIKI
jgi:quinol-cytochrome oxidoreductase complex cytochrome b subunit